MDYLAHSLINGSLNTRAKNLQVFLFKKLIKSYSLRLAFLIQLGSATFRVKTGNSSKQYYLKSNVSEMISGNYLNICRSGLIQLRE